MSHQFGRLITAMATPFTADNQLNIPEAVRLAESLAANGNDSVLLTGTTGESPTLTHEEELDLYKAVVAALKGRTPIIAGTGSNSTATAVSSTQKAEALGVDGVLQVVPYYNRPSQEGLYLHFKTVAENTSLPIIMYNIPSRTGRNLEPETIERLSHIPNIIGIKEASGSIDQVKRIRLLTNADTFVIYSGDDALTLPFMDEGACGVISVAANLPFAGRLMAHILAKYAKGDIVDAYKMFNNLKPMFDALFITSNPSPVKLALTEEGFAMGKPRLPLVEPNREEHEKITEAIKKSKLLFAEILAGIS